MTTRLPAERTLPFRPTWHAFSILVLCSLAFTGCASMMNGRTQVVAVSSDPPGAHVFVDNEHVGVTPTFVDLPRRERNLALRLGKEGFGPVRVPVRRFPSGWLWGDAAQELAFHRGFVSVNAVSQASSSRRVRHTLSYPPSDPTQRYPVGYQVPDGPAFDISGGMRIRPNRRSCSIAVRSGQSRRCRQRRRIRALGNGGQSRTSPVWVPPADELDRSSYGPARRGVLCRAVALQRSSGTGDGRPGQRVRALAGE